MEPVIGISQFKIHALRILEEISTSQEPVVITKRGKPLVRIIPYRELDKTLTPGSLARYFVFEKDIVSPLGADMWESAE